MGSDAIHTCSTDCLSRANPRGDSYGQRRRLSGTAGDFLRASINPMRADLGTRLKRFYQVVDHAHTRFRVVGQATTLKVFMEPEFYFRPPPNEGGRFRAYEFNDVIEASPFSK